MLISIVIPSYNESRYIEDCISSLYNMELPKDHYIEVLVIDGRSEDGTREIVRSLKRAHQSLRLIDNPNQKTPIALNIGIQESNGEMIMIASAHSKYEKSYLSTLISEKKRLRADVAGGIMKAVVKKRTRVSYAIKTVLSSSFGIGNSFFRIGVSQPAIVDTVPFGLYKRELLQEVGGYDERLTRNHDIELSKRLKVKGARIYLVPDAVSYYYVREKLGQCIANSFSNGYWNILTLYVTKRFSSLSLRHFVPLAFISSLVIPPLLVSIWGVALLHLSWMSLTLYALFVLINAFNAVKQYKDLSFVHVALAAVTVHFSYGIGSLFAMTRLDRLSK